MCRKGLSVVSSRWNGWEETKEKAYNFNFFNATAAKEITSLNYNQNLSILTASNTDFTAVHHEKCVMHRCLSKAATITDRWPPHPGTQPPAKSCSVLSGCWECSSFHHKMWKTGKSTECAQQEVLGTLCNWPQGKLFNTLQIEPRRRQRKKYPGKWSQNSQRTMESGVFHREHIWGWIKKYSGLSE